MKASELSTESAKPVASPVPRSRRSAWLRLVVHSHWMSSAISLVGMILFAITGITLNHATSIQTKPRIEQRQLTLPAEHRIALARQTDQASPVLDAATTGWLSDQFGFDVSLCEVETSGDEIYLSRQRPGKESWIVVDRNSGSIEMESTDRGWIAYFNDLHKGRHTGPVWAAFLDVFAVASLIFCFTGLLLLYQRQKHRRWTWPLVALGWIAPWFLLAVFIH